MYPTRRSVHEGMPRLRVETIDSHRRALHEAILDTTAALAAAPGEGRARAGADALTRISTQQVRRKVS